MKAALFLSDVYISKNLPHLLCIVNLYAFVFQNNIAQCDTSDIGDTIHIFFSLLVEVRLDFSVTGLFLRRSPPLHISALVSSAVSRSPCSLMLPSMRLTVLSMTSIVFSNLPHLLDIDSGCINTATPAVQPAPISIAIAVSIYTVYHTKLSC